MEGFLLEDELVVVNGVDVEVQEDGVKCDFFGDVDEEEEDVGGWDMGDDVVLEIEEGLIDVNIVEVGGVGSSEVDFWVCNLFLVVDYVVGGLFEFVM